MWLEWLNSDNTIVASLVGNCVALGWRLRLSQLSVVSNLVLFTKTLINFVNSLWRLLNLFVSLIVFFVNCLLGCMELV